MDWSWAVEGITEDMPRSTGPECAGYITTKRKICEGVVVTLMCIVALKWGVQRLQPINIMASQQQSHPEAPPPPPLGKQILLVAMTFILGMEMGFKLATKTVIFALNPCHITTIIQIYLLAARPSKTTTALFRIHMNYLNGPLLAFVFPDADSRLLPLEATTYWIQHGLMFIIPIYLLRLGGAYQMEDITDFKWNIISYAFCLIYHFVVLQIMSVISNVNLNHMLCAASSDPFDGPNYRLCAVIHQAILCPFLCKLFSILFKPTNNLDFKHAIENNRQLYKNYDTQSMGTPVAAGVSSMAAATLAGRYDDQIMTTKID